MTLDTDRLVRETFVARVEHYPVLGSTNDRAKLCAAEGTSPLPLLIVADQQTAGRGRGSNRWWTGRGALAFSLLADGRSWGAGYSRGPLVSLSAAVGVTQTAGPLLPGLEVGIHWPNDVFAAGRKLAGILVETLAGGLCVVGIGLNLNNSTLDAPAELRAVASTVFDLTGTRHDSTLVLITLLQRLAALLDQLPASPELVGRLADGLCLQRGRALSIESGGKTIRGKCVGIASDGALLLDTPSGRERVVIGVLTAGGASCT
jgi:BirA family transcriptional regulator, biotin operon repressor / biotin---[acetyl-CoA-carboxylase] ligase